MSAPDTRRLINAVVPRGLTLSPIEIVGAGLAAAGLLYVSSLATDLVEQPLFLAPLAASIAIMFATPGMTPTRSWNVIAGQFLSASIAFAVVTLIPAHDGKIAAPIAFSLALLAMRVCRCVHPPACATVMVVTLTAAAHSISFLFFPVLLGSIVIVCFAWFVHVVEARVPPKWGGRTTPHHGEPDIPVH